MKRVYTIFWHVNDVLVCCVSDLATITKYIITFCNAKHRIFFFFFYRITLVEFGYWYLLPLSEFFLQQLEYPEKGLDRGILVTISF